MISRARLFSIFLSSLLITACASDDEYDLMALDSDSTSSDADDSESDLLDEHDEHDEDDTVLEESGDDVESPDEGTLPHRVGDPDPQVIFINGSGRTVSPGGNSSSSSKGTSSLVKNRARRFPASKFHRTKDWNELMAAVRKDFSAYNVEIVDERPDSPPYIEVIVSNVKGTYLNYKETTTGVSPISCGVLENTIAFVFDKRLRSPQSVANTISHEAGHALSLSHTQTADDIMSYVSKVDGRFVNTSARCGTKPGNNQNCICRDGYGRRLTRQNNHEQLNFFLGKKKSTNQTPKTSKQLTISTPNNRTDFLENSRITIDVDASKINGLKDVVLSWRPKGGQTKTFECRRTPNIECTKKKNGTYSFSIVVGSGTRYVTAVATTSGGTLRSATSTLEFKRR